MFQQYPDLFEPHGGVEGFLSSHPEPGSNSSIFHMSPMGLPLSAEVSDDELASCCSSCGSFVSLDTPMMTSRSLVLPPGGASLWAPLGTHLLQPRAVAPPRSSVAPSRAAAAAELSGDIELRGPRSDVGH